MSIPSFNVFLHPTLEFIAQKGAVEQPRQTVLAPVASALGLSSEECEEVLESGGSRLVSRCGWALTYLKKAGLISFPRRNYTEITEEGRQFLAKYKSGFGIAELDRIAEFASFRAVDATGEGEKGSRKKTTVGDEGTPEEKIVQAVEEIKNAVADEVLDHLRVCTPKFFEQVVLRLIRAMGYGKSEASVRHTGGAGDFGIDGIVSLDLLGFDKICLQAKRWQAKVNQAVVRDFIGALEHQRAKKGVILTTSSFAPDAKECADRSEKQIVLIDGQKLAALMVEYGVGVESSSVRLPKIDLGFFEHPSGPESGMSEGL